MKISSWRRCRGRGSRGSVRFTCLPGRLPRTSSSFVMTSSTSNEELAIASPSDDEPAVACPAALPRSSASASIGRTRSVEIAGGAPASMLCVSHAPPPPRRAPPPRVWAAAAATPPPPDPLPELVLGTVIAANLAVFGVWHELAGGSLGWSALRSVAGRAHARAALAHDVTNAFSQLQPGHRWSCERVLASSSLGAYSRICLMLGMFGRELPRRLGIGGFAALYLSGSLCSSSAWLAGAEPRGVARNVVRRARAHHGEGCVGASGAVAACVMGACVLDPLRRIYRDFVIPMPAMGLRRRLCAL